MEVAVVDFIKSPQTYLDRIINGSIFIMRENRPIAVLSRPSDTPISDSLLGVLKDSGVRDIDDIKAERLGV